MSEGVEEVVGVTTSYKAAKKATAVGACGGILDHLQDHQPEVWDGKLDHLQLFYLWTNQVCSQEGRSSPAVLMLSK